MKKRFAVMFAVLVACVMVVAAANVVSAEETSGTCGDNLSWTFDADTGTLTISGAGEMPMIIGMPWGNLPVKHVIIEEGVTSICEFAFSGKKEIVSIEIADSVTTIGAYALSGTGLTEFVMPAGLTEIPQDLLSGCENLKKVVLHSGVTLVGMWAFQDCAALTEVVLPEGNYRFDGATFSNCDALKTIEIPEGVWLLGGACFEGCDNLETVKLPSTLVELSHRTFADCVSLKQITLPNGMNLLGSEIFSGCTGLESVHLSATIDRIAWQPFEGCVNLCNITIDQSNPHFKVADGMILSKDGTQLVTVSGGLRGEMVIPDSVSLIAENAARGCTLISSVRLPQNISSIPNGAFAECIGLEKITIPASVTAIENEAFLNCENLKRIDFLGDLPQMADNAFQNVKADAYYPEGNKSWLYKEDPYGSTLNWPQDLPDSPYRGVCGKTAIWEYDPQTGTMTVSGEGAIDDLDPWGVGFWDKERITIKKLIICEGITHIGSRAFSANKSLTDIQLPKSLVTIGKAAFAQCTALTSVTMPDGLTEIGSGAFQECTALVSVTLADSITEIGANAFSLCASLKNVKLPSSLKVLSYSLFSGCIAMEKIEIPNGIIKIDGHAFSRCESLYDVRLPDTLESIGTDAFYECAALHSIRIPASVTDIRNGAFGQCEDLMYVVFMGSAPPMDGSVFSGNEMYIYYPAGDPSWSGDVIEQYLFQTLMLTPVEDPGALELPLKSDPFSGPCGPNATWKYKDGVLTISGNGPMEFSKWAAYCNEIREVVIADGITSLCDYAFAGCVQLSKITLPNSITEIGASVFDGCEALVQVDLPDSLTVIREMLFFHCLSLEKVDMPSGITAIENGAFSGCGALKKITLPEGLTCIGEHAFSGCASLKSITFPASVAVLEKGAFGHCTGITKIYFVGDYPDMAYSIFDDVTATMYYPRDNTTWKEGKVLSGGGNMTMVGMTTVTSGTCGENLTWKLNGDVLTISGTGEMEEFLASAPWQYYAKDVTKVIIEDGVTSISFRAFFEFTALEKVVLGSGLKRIGGQAFRGCVELEAVELPAGLEYIGDFSFMDCKKLQTIVIPASVNTIFTNAFKNCKAMTTVYFEGSAPDMDYPFLNMTATVYYPVGDSSWNSSTMKQYGGKLTWQKYCPEGHTFGDWTVLEEPTYEKAGQQERTCKACGEIEQQQIPMLQPTPPPTVPTEPATKPTQPSTQPTEPTLQPTEQPTQPTESVGGTQQPDGETVWWIIGICIAVVLTAGCLIAIPILKRKK